MRKLVLKMSVSADGFVGGPNGEIDWIFKSMDEGATEWTLNTIWQAGAHIMGSRTFHDMASYWPFSEEPFAAPMNAIPKIVFSRSPIDKVKGAQLTTRALEDASRVAKEKGINPKNEGAIASWNNAQIASGDLQTEIEKLKQQPGKDIMAHGGASFAQALVKHGLVDEYKLLIHPVVLGVGLPLFALRQKTLELRLISSTTFTSGAIANVYRPS